MFFEALAVLLSLRGANIGIYKNVEAVTGEKSMLLPITFFISYRCRGLSPL